MVSRAFSLAFSIATDETLEKGPISAIEEEKKALCERGKSHPKFAIGPIDYWIPTTHLEAAVAAAKRHGKFREAQ